MQEHRRRHWNRELALQLAKAGLPVFPTDSDTKTPLVKRFTQLDDAIPRDEVETLNAEKHAEDIAAGRKPTDHVAIGATLHPDVIRRMWRAYPDATPSISTGPAGLLVIDADIKEGVNGPDRLREYFEPYGGIPKDAAVIHTQNGGMHVYFRNTAKLGCAKGAFADMRCDIRGIGGQVIAPAAIRVDGRTYTPDEDFARLVPSFINDTLADVPDHVVTTIGTKPERKEDAKLTTETEHRLQEELETATDESFDDLFTDECLAVYDLAALAEKDETFRALYANPTEDTSENRFQMARRLRAEWPHMSIGHYATFLENWEGAGTYVEDQPKKGEYNDRSIKREFVKGENEFRVSDGKVFGAVEEAAEDALYEYKLKATKVEKNAKLVEAARARRVCDIVADYTPMKWLAKNLIPATGVGTIHGAPNVGKSFVAIDLCEHVGNGMNWMGFKTKRAAALYLYSEGETGIAGRFKAWCDRHGSRNGDVFVARVPNLFANKEAEKIILAVAAQAAAELGRQIGLIVVDTLAAATAGADENAASDMGPVMERLNRVSSKLGAAVLVIHHVNKTTGKMRGSSAIEGAVDFSLLVEEETAKNGRALGLKLKAVKLRDAYKSKDGIAFKLDIVKIGEDEDGEDVTSCVVKSAHTASALAVEADDDAVEATAPPADDEPPATDDELTPEQFDAAEKVRVERCGKIAAWVGAQPGGFAWLNAARAEFKFLTDMKRRAPSHFVDNINSDIMDHSGEVRVGGGRLQFKQAGKGARGRYQFKFVASG